MDIQMNSMIVIISSLFLTTCKCIKITNLVVPEVVNENSDVTLRCQFALQGSELYSAKWYRNGKEFYRYAPLDLPPAQVFISGGVTVDLENSNSKTVSLRHVNLDDGGVYMCEVSGETPYFETDSASKAMNVVALPDEKPIIDGGKDSYHVGNTVDVNCTSQRSKPALTLTWFMNGIRAPSHYVKVFKYTKDVNGKFRRTANLKFIADESKFMSGKMVLKCTAMVETFDESPEARFVASYRKSSDVVFSRVEVTDISSKATSPLSEVVTRTILTSFFINNLLLVIR